MGNAYKCNHNFHALSCNVGINKHSSTSSHTTATHWTENVPCDGY